MNIKRQIPNMLSVLRLLMIPAFVVTYFNHKATVSTIIYIAAWLTDALDGYLARRNNWITDVGKILDPVADKLMQFSAAVCFSVDNKIFLLVSIPLFIKEMIMLLASVLIKKTQNITVSANWYGKVATVLLFICAFIRLLVRDNGTLDVAIAIIMLSCMIFSFLMYYFKDFKGKYKDDIFHK